MSSSTCNMEDIQVNDSNQLKHYDFRYHGIPPNTKEDILMLSKGVTRESAQMLLQRVAKLEMWFIYICITVIYVLFIISVVSGIKSEWYRNLNKTGVNPYVIGILWAVATGASYLSIFMIWEHISDEEISIDFVLSIYFLIGAFMSLLWTTILFQGNNIVLATWVSFFVFLYYFWLFNYIRSFRFVASLFIIPLVVIYGYFLYSMVHLSCLNNIII